MYRKTVDLWKLCHHWRARHASINCLKVLWYDRHAKFIQVQGFLKETAHNYLRSCVKIKVVQQRRLDKYKSSSFYTFSLRRRTNASDPSMELGQPCATLCRSNEPSFKLVCISEEMESLFGLDARNCRRSSLALLHQDSRVRVTSELISAGMDNIVWKTSYIGYPLFRKDKQEREPPITRASFAITSVTWATSTFVRSRYVNAISKGVTRWHITHTLQYVCVTYTTTSRTVHS